MKKCRSDCPTMAVAAHSCVGRQSRSGEIWWKGQCSHVEHLGGAEQVFQLPTTLWRYVERGQQQGEEGGRCRDLVRDV
jgi:hypothetical protein